MKRRWIAATASLALVSSLFLAGSVPSQAGDAAEKKDPAVERARREVRMLDDLYKTAVVQITTHYVDGVKDVSAGTAAKLLFAAMQKNGWHEVRLLDATGKPIVEENAPRDAYE